MNRMILGRKIGMTQIFDETGRRISVTVVKVGPMQVIQVKSKTGKDGYNAVKIGFEAARALTKDGVEGVRWRGINKPELGVFEKAGIETPLRIVREFHCNDARLAEYTVGQTIDYTLFAEGEILDVSATSKGKGTAGVMKRHNFSGFKSSHGVHETFRGPGSVGCRATPGRTFPGHRMAGRMGNVRTTTQNLKLVKVLADDCLYLIRGAIPGCTGTLVEIHPSLKKSQANA